MKGESMYGVCSGFGWVLFDEARRRSGTKEEADALCKMMAEKYRHIEYTVKPFPES